MDLEMIEAKNIKILCKNILCAAFCSFIPLGRFSTILCADLVHVYVLIRCIFYVPI